MFTNWLTGTTSLTNSNINNNNVINGHNNATASTSNASQSNNSTTAAAAVLASNPTSIMSTPPDVILEVGPAPSVRFVAHSIVLSMHSGYLRSAIRLDENAIAATGHHVTSSGASSEFILYLGNVTAEQFAPLLTYMYTGYLDLNVENIFGVLLATHVLHMPRALEICRSFLARAQTEGYLGANLTASLSVAATTSAAAGQQSNSNGKIIRPIASKATLPNFGFMPAAAAAAAAVPTPTPTPLAAHQLQLPTVVAGNSYKNLQHAYAAAAASKEQQQQKDDIDVDYNSNSPKNVHNTVGAEDDAEDEEVEVFIDSNTETDNELDGIDGNSAISVVSIGSATTMRTLHERATKRVEQNEERLSEREIVITINEKARNHKNEAPQVRSSNKQQRQSKNAEKREKRNKTTRHAQKNSGLQVAKAPIPASQLDTNEGSKVIIDVASCDGPVRFRRILNTAYGHKPNAAYAAAHAVMPERTQQSVSYSFHQQMAKTISQQRQMQQAEESENSESSSGGGGNSNSATGAHVGKHGSKQATNEIYVCVYCKHTFKSQYCYQKHAKRHLNPLSLNCASSGSTATTAETRSCDKRLGASINDTGYATNALTRVGALHTHTLAIPQIMSSGVGIKQHAATELLRREVRPLDMNVQYYPCKTCGSKFPSYYFVHKHRKMCHADEEVAAAAAESGTANNRSSTNNHASGSVGSGGDEGGNTADEANASNKRSDGNGKNERQNMNGIDAGAGSGGGVGDSDGSNSKN